MTTSSSNYTGLYGGGTTTAIPNTAYGNANVVSLLAAGSDGANTVGNVSAIGNVSGNYFIGNGSLLTGIAASYGNAQVASYLASGTVASNIITSANISGSYVLGNGSQLTGLPATYANANVVSLLASFGSNTISTTGNVTAGNFIGSGAALTAITGANVTGTVPLATSATTAGTVTTAAQPNITSVGTLTSLSSSGNVTAAYFIGDGSLLSNINAGNIVGSYGNANVVSLLAGFGSNSISTTGNVTASYFAGNGSLLTSLTGGNVTGTVPLATSATTAGTVTTAAQPNITSVGTLTSLSSSGNISATGNITGSYLFGNGSQLTGLPATYGNANVATFLANFGSNTLSTTGNVTGGNILSGTFQAVNSGGGSLKNASGTNQLQWGGGGGNNITLEVATNITPANAAVAISPTGTGTVAIAPVGGGAINNMIIGNVTPAAVNATTVSATGNITGSFFIGNGSQLTGIATSSYGDPNVVSLLASFGSNTIVTTGNITGGNVIATTLLTAPQLITTGGAGNITGVNYITANYFVGNGSLLTNINAANITGAYGNANVSNFLANGFGSNTITTTGNITGGNLITSGTAAAGVVSATGNVQGGNIVVPNNGKFRGDFSSLTTAGRTVFQTTSTSTTAPTIITAIPGPSHVAGPTTNGSATGLFSSNDVGNSSIFGMFSLGSEARIWSTSAGTGNVNNLLFRFGTSANLAATLTSTGTFSAVGNVQGGNILGIGSGLTGINAFGNVAVAGQTTVSADTTTDTLTLTAGTNIIITTDAANNKVTITSSAGESISPLMLMGG
jgi:hypothetical protein